MKRLAVFGAGGHGRVVADAALSGDWSEVVFYDDRWPALKSAGPWDVAGTGRDLLEHGHFDAAVVAIGDNVTRLARQREFIAAGISIATIFHRSTVVSTHAVIGGGSVVCTSGVVNRFATLGSAVIINTSATADHDCILEDGVHLSGGVHLGGGVRIGEATLIGLGAMVRPGVTIGANVVVGMGAVVVSDLPSGITVVGVPARPFRKKA